MAYHAQRSPSSSSRWSDCTASIDEQAGLPNQNSEASMLGTCLHQTSAECLEHGYEPDSYLGRRMLFWADPLQDVNGEDWEEAFREPDPLGIPNTYLWKPGVFPALFNGEVVLDRDDIDALFDGVTYVRERIAQTGAIAFFEQRAPIGWFTGERRDGQPVRGDETPDELASGTSDVVLLYGSQGPGSEIDTIESMDFKYGRHKVTACDIIAPGEPPKRRMNLQLACYVLGAWWKHCRGKYKIKRVKATIVQPFLNHVDEFDCSLEELMEVKDFLAGKAWETWHLPIYSPSQDNCHFCKAKLTCEARAKAVLSSALEGFDDANTVHKRSVPADKLGHYYSLLSMIRGWCDDIGAQVYELLSAGYEVRRQDGLRYVLVQAKDGRRKWRDETRAAQRLIEAGLKEDQVYEKSVRTPAVIEKEYAKRRRGGPPPVLGKEQWAALAADNIHQNPGGKTVALETDVRPEAANADGFTDVAGEVDLASLGL